MNLDQIALLNAGAVAVEIGFHNTPLISGKQFDGIFDNIVWCCIGQTALVFYCQCDGKTLVGRNQGPAITVMTNDGQKIEIFMKDGVLHNLDGPAVIMPGVSKGSKIQLWYLNGVLRKKKIDMPYLFINTITTEEIDYFDNGRVASTRATYLSDEVEEIQVSQYSQFVDYYMNLFSVTGQPVRQHWWLYGINITSIVKFFKKVFKRGP